MCTKGEHNGSGWRASAAANNEKDTVHRSGDHRRVKVTL